MSADVLAELRPPFEKMIAAKQAALAEARKNIQTLEADLTKLVETFRTVFNFTPASEGTDPSPEPSTMNGSAKNEPKPVVQVSAPVVAKPTPEVRPAPEPKPAEAKPVEPKPVVAKPIVAKPVVAKPVETKPVEAKPTASEAKPPKKRGKRSLKEDIATVMGTHTMNAKQVYEALADQGWLPMSNNPPSYVAYTLSAFPERFARMSRGQYRVATAPPAPKSEPAPASSPMNDSEATDAVLRDAGIIPVQPN